MIVLCGDLMTDYLLKDLLLHLTGWWIDWLTDWLTDWLIDLLIDWLIDCLMDGLTDWQTERLNDWLYVIFLHHNDHWKIDWQINRIFDCLSVCLSLSLTDWSRHYLAPGKHSNSKKKLRWYTYPSSLARDKHHAYIYREVPCKVQLMLLPAKK